MVRLAREKDFDFVKKSWEVCFDDTPEFVNWNFEYNYSVQNTMIAESNHTPAAVMQLMPYNLMIGGHETAIRYVSGVATLPEYRGKGLVRELFSHGLPQMYNMGATISILFPAVSGMYEKFGYTTVLERNFYKTDRLWGMEISNFADIPFEKLNKIYSSHMQQKGVYIKRSISDWKKIMTDLIKLSGGRVLLSENGYALAYPKDDFYEICEICGCEITGAPLPQFPVMARIINAEKIRQMFPEFSHLSINDTFISQNNIVLQNGGENVDISDLTKHLFAKLQKGYINMLL